MLREKGKKKKAEGDRSQLVPVLDSGQNTGKWKIDRYGLRVYFSPFLGLTFHEECNVCLVLKREA